MPGPPSPSELQSLAEEAARTAGELLVARFAGERRGVRAKSSPTDLVSEADLASERAIRDLIAARRPDDGLVAEEGADRPGESGLRWVVDPLDATVNFLFGIPHWCVSVACEDDRGAIAGVVHDPLRDETFAATRDGASTLNGEPIEASGRTELATAMVATGFGYEAERRRGQAEVVARVLPRVRDIRRAGSAALDLAWTACGRLDAYYECGVEHWDRAAGALICERVGLDVSELERDGDLPAGVLVAPPPLIAPLRALIVG